MCGGFDQANGLCHVVKLKKIHICKGRFWRKGEIFKPIEVSSHHFADGIWLVNLLDKRSNTA